VASITVSKLFELALKRINVIQGGGTLQPTDADDALFYANNWIDSLAIDAITIPFQLGTTFPMVSGQASYTVGTGGNVNIPRPTYIDHVNYIDASLNPPIERELTELTPDAWDAIPIKGLTNPLPTFYYWQPTYATSGQGTLYFWLVPTSSVLTGVIYAGSPVAQFVNLTDTLALPPGWQWFIQENLAVFFASIFRENLPVDPQLAESAKMSKLLITRANMRTKEMTLDPALTYNSPRSNIYTGP
jgi:hypothetical protein